MRITLFILLLWTLTINAQVSKLDSLWGKWSNASLSDSTRLKSMSDYIWDGFLFTKPDSAFVLADLEYQFAKETNDTIYQCDALNIKGISNAVRGNNDQALLYFDATLLLAIATNDNLLQAKMANNIAVIHRDRGNFSKSDDYFLRALVAFEKEENKKGQANAYNNLGISLMNQGNYGSAYEYFDRSMKINQELNNFSELAIGYNNIGNVLKNQGDIDEALEYYNNSLEIALENKLIRQESSATTNIGLIYKEKGYYDKALEWLEKSLSLKKQINSKRGMSTVYNNFGNIYIKKEDYKLAIQFINKSLVIEEELQETQGIALSFANLGRTYSLIGNSLKTINPDSAMAAYALAENYCTRSLEIAHLIGTNDPLQVAYTTLFEINYERSDLSGAFERLNDITHNRDRSIKFNFFTLSERDKEIYFNTMVEDYELMYDFAMLQQTIIPQAIDTVFNYVLKNKAITLKSSTAMRQQILDSGDSSLIASYQSWITLKKQLTEGKVDTTQRAQVELEARELEKTLSRNSKEFNYFESLEKLNWQDVQKHLQKDEAAVEFIHYNSTLTKDTAIVYAALIITPGLDHPQYIQVCTENELANFLKKASGDNPSIIKQLYGSKNQLNEELYKLIWKPIENALQGSKTIFLSPSGLLHKISFSALAKDKNTYLCDAININHMGSTGKLIDYKTNTTILEQNTYLIGGVDYNTDSTRHKLWSYLPNTLAETESIYAQLTKKGYPVEQLTGVNASEATIKDICTKAGILHLSSHGFFFPNPKVVKQEILANEFYQENVFFRGTSEEEMRSIKNQNVYAQWSFVDNQNPLMRSGIVLSGGNDVWQRSALAVGEDGILTAAEVANIDMRNTDLVVLSACESGLGDIKGSEGVYGLQRSFKMAGVDFLITSLWQVPDKETAEFMTLFYKNLSKSKDIKTSFLKAQKAMRKQYDPYYWSAFVLME